MSSDNLAAVNTSENQLSVRLIADFDGTLTRNDTLEIVADIGYARHAARQTGKLLTPWREIGNLYMTDYNKHRESYRPIAEQRRKLSEECKWLASLKDVEDASFNRAIQAGIFDDLSPVDIAKSARQAVQESKITFRFGWTELFSTICSHNANLLSPIPPEDSIQIISVNWSRKFIGDVMRSGLQNTPCSDYIELQRWSDNARVYANELPSLQNESDPNSRNATSEMLTPAKGYHVQTSSEKLSVFRGIRDHIKANMKEPKSSQPPTRSFFIYVGDSTTDLECLLEADCGICIRDDPIRSGQQELMDTCSRLNIPVLHLTDSAVLEADGAHTDCLSLLWANDFIQIQDWLLLHIKKLSSL